MNMTFAFNAGLQGKEFAQVFNERNREPVLVNRFLAGQKIFMQRQKRGHKGWCNRNTDEDDEL